MMEIINDSARRQLTQMLCSLIFFHVSEYLLAIVYHGKFKVTLESVLISKDYILAMAFSVLEYLIELYFFPTLKKNSSISNLGLFMVILGETIRKLAICTAGRAFTHVIRRSHENHHKLITYGVYGIVRHPGYTGFLIWCVGIQIMLCNPVSSVVFAIIVWDFFFNRIAYEEFFLKRFFGLEYEVYAQRVPSGIPFVK
ncbi:protein-S-isoprenylcysteine O-methyltransferase B-like [Rutidosis leptorrhynchoides]|uniref:protein-S-isoprenylcysteine O-methyltransferase B-like n=1 Tax=Rutidosis leptorrhynchoides TaxID=125765 RepID=UPI003A99964E